MANVKMADSVKAELEKIAGEIQAKRSGNVTLSDAVAELIKEHRDRKGGEKK